MQPSPTPGASLPHPGHIFEKKYRIQKLLGTGGFARVYLANFEDLGRRVAIKILVPTEPAPTLYPHRLNARFQREAKLISELRHPATVTMYDFGRSENGLLYMVFEFVDGKTVEEVIAAEGALSPERTATIIEQLLRSLDEAHSRGILHRDIKPANVMVYDYLDEKDLVKLLDFGIAKPILSEDDTQNLTRDNTLLGTPRYMSPEQIVNEELTPASDLYSLGLLAFEMVSGEPALAETDRSTIIRKHLDAKTFELPAHLPIPDDFRSILEKMVAKRIDERFATAKDALRAFEQWRAGTLDLPVSSTPAPHWSEQKTENPDAHPQPEQTYARQPNGAPTVQRGFAQPNPNPSGFQSNPPTGFGSVQQSAPSFGGAAPATAPGNAIAKPPKTKIVIEQSPTKMTVDVPPIPSHRDLVYVGVSLVGLLLSITIFYFPAVVFTGVALAFSTARLLVESSLVIDRHTGYEINQSVLGFDRSSRGPLGAVLRMTHKVGDDELASLKVATHDGDRLFARNVSPEEARWVEQTVNGFLEASRDTSQ